MAKVARLFLVAILVLGILLSVEPGLSSENPAAETQTRIRVDSSLVIVPVNITSAKGTFVSGLKAGNFHIFEDGREQSITLFREEDAPVTVGLVVDHSRSMGPKLPAVALAVQGFARSSNPDDEMFVVDFNDFVSVELMHGKPFTDNPGELEEALKAVSAQGQTALYDAVTEALVHVELGQWDKKAVIIVSDGGDNASHVKFPELLARAQRSHVVVYCIGLVDEAGEEENPRALKRLSDATGGMAFFTKRSEEAGKFIKQIAQDLREQYTLGYVPPKTNRTSFRKVTVRVSAPGAGELRVRARPGYFPRPPKSQSAAASGSLP